MPRSTESVSSDLLIELAKNLGPEMLVFAVDGEDGESFAAGSEGSTNANTVDELTFAAAIDWTAPDEFHFVVSAENQSSNRSVASIEISAWHADSLFDSVSWTSESSSASMEPVVSGHEDYSLWGGKWGAQTMGTAGGVVTWSLVGSGWLDQTGDSFFSGATVALSSFLNFDYVSVLQYAFAAWSQVANIDFQYVADGGGNIGAGTNANIRIAGGYMDGVSNVLASAFYPVRGGSGRPEDYAISGDTVFDSSDSWTASKFLAVATHEIGHAIGLQHSALTSALMYPYYNPSITAPTTDDVAGAQAIYGARPGAGYISVNDVTLNEGTGGNTTFTFTITRTGGGTVPFSVYYATSDGTAVAGSDYIAASGLLQFGLGETTKTVSVTVYGDTTKENHETFFFNLAGANSGVILDGQGQGTIVNDDVDDYGATWTSAEQLKLGTRIYGGVETLGDHDWFAVDLKEGMTYELSVRGAGQSGGTLVNPTMGLRDWTGSTQIAYSDDAVGNDPFISYNYVVNSRPSQHFIDVGAYGDNLTGTYTLDFVAVNALAAAQNFEANRGSDILWRSNVGHLATWESLDGTSQSGQSFGIVGTEWKVQATADFNGDGRTDLVWRSDNGDIVTWDSLSGSSNGGVSYGNVGTNWIIRGAGDFNADGRADFLFRATNGDVVTWDNLQANGSHGGVSYGNVGLNWHIVGTGDFDKDNRTDIVWRSESGDLAIWTNMQANGSHGGFSLYGYSANLHVVGIGDFNADGKSDILWRSNTGEVLITESISTSVSHTRKSLGSVGLQWSIVDVGDYNGDGQSDILWRGQDGSLVVWDQIYGSTHGGRTLGSVGLEWSIQDDNFEYV